MISSLTLVPLLLLSNVAHFSSQAKPYNFEPESRHIDINEGDDFTVSFDEIGNQTVFGHCYIESESYSADYAIYAPPNDTDAEIQPYSDTYKGFQPYNNTGICGFIFWTVDDKTPLNWTITAYDNPTKSYSTEIVTVTFYYNMPLYVDKVHVLPSASAVNFLQAGDTKVTKCTLAFDNASVALDLNAVKVYDGDNIFKKRLMSLGNGMCGYKINNLAVGESKNLVLYATDDKNKVYRSISSINIMPGKNLINRTIAAYLGDSALVYCGSRNPDDHVDSDQKYCQLFNPKGDLVSRDRTCEYELDVVTLDDLGLWKCSVGYKYIMDTLELTTELVEKKAESVVPFTEDTTDYLIVGCKFNNLIELSYCKFIRPDGKTFTVNEGTATAYYNTFSTNMSDSRCSLEILKPLRDEDKGTWRCVGGLTQSIIGAFITVETSTNFPYDKYSKKNIQLGHSFVIDCMVPYATDYCYIVAPNGTQHKPNDVLEAKAGYCSLLIEEATASDNGTWSCSVAQKNGIPDEIIRVDISVIEVKVLYADAEATEDDQVQLICNTNGIPINYCRFVSPSGSSYSLRKDDAAFNKITYRGRGLEYGDCGIQISKVTQSDAGQWTCYISPGRYDQNKIDISKKVQLLVNSPVNISTAGSVGIAVGVLAVVIATAGFIFYRYSRRRSGGSTDATAQFTGRESNDSRSSGETVVLAVPQNTYNT